MKTLPSITTSGSLRAGFSLPEMVAVMAIVAILIGLTVPGFQAHTRNAHRTEARLVLQEVMEAQHRHRLRHKTYTGGLEDIDGLKVVDLAVLSPQKRYTITAQTCEDIDIKHCVRLVATPSPTLHNLTLTLDSNGGRAPAEAWR